GVAGEGAEEVELAATEQALDAVDRDGAKLAAGLEQVAASLRRDGLDDVVGVVAALDGQRGLVADGVVAGHADGGETDKTRVGGEPLEAALRGVVDAGVLVGDLAAEAVEAEAGFPDEAGAKGVGVGDDEVLAAIQQEAAEAGGVGAAVAKRG